MSHPPWVLLLLFFSTVNCDFKPGLPWIHTYGATYRRELRIVGGKQTNIGEFPSALSLQTNHFRHFCGATLINIFHALTSANCVFQYKGGIKPRKDYQIMAGDVSLALNRRGKFRIYRRAAMVFVHPEYNNQTRLNDIAVLRLTLAIPTVDQVTYAVPMARVPPSSGTLCFVAGWGHLKFDEKRMVDDLQDVMVALFTTSKCKNIYDDVFFGDTMFCAGAVHGGRDACEGDFGGGLFCGDFVAGIASYSNGCGSPYSPAIYINISAYYEWIEECIYFRGKQEDIKLPPYERSGGNRDFKTIYVWLSIGILLY